MKTETLKLLFQATRIVITVILLIYGLIFFGVLTAGFIDLRTVFKGIDYIYVLLYITLGALVVLLCIDRLWRWYQKNAFERALKKWQREKSMLLLATFVFVLLYFLRFTIPSLLLYAGFMIGSFFIKIARNAYLFLFGLDLNTYKIGLFAWVFQWQFVYAVLDFFSRLFKKKGQNLKETESTAGTQP